MTWHWRLLSRWRSWLPELLLAILCLSLALFSPQGPLLSDDRDYDILARSIQQGRYSLDGVQPTMQREPGYPALRAIVYTLGGNARSILLVQAILVVLTAILWRRSWRTVQPELGWIGAWGTVLAYGYWLFVPKAQYEIVLGFWLALSVFLMLRFWRRPSIQNVAAAGLVFSVLILTRGVYLFLWIPMFLLGWWIMRKTVPSKKQMLKYFAAFALACLLLPGAWMMRNGRTFGSYSLADRPGLVLMCRAALVSAPFPSYMASIGSVLMGEQALKTLVPNAQPVVDQQWAEADKLLRSYTNGTGTLSHDADRRLLEEAKSRVFASPQSFVYYLAWTPVELAHLFGLPSPNYPHATMETMFRGQPLPLPITKLFVLLGIHCGQAIYWFVMVYGIVRAFQNERKVFFLSLPILYLVVIHAPLDNVVRFAAPTQPIQMAFVLYGMTNLFQKIRPRF